VHALKREVSWSRRTGGAIVVQRVAMVRTSRLSSVVPVTHPATALLDRSTQDALDLSVHAPELVGGPALQLDVQPGIEAKGEGLPGCHVGSLDAGGTALSGRYGARRPAPAPAIVRSLARRPADPGARAPVRPSQCLSYW
jgi:hypothetical protein